MKAWLLVGALVVLPAHAAELSAEASARASMEYNENLLLDPEQPEEAQGGNLDLRAQLTRRTEKSELALAPRARFLRYDTEIDHDSDDAFVDAWYDYRGEQLQTRLSAGWTHDSTLTSELEDTGLVDARKRHEQFFGSGLVSFDFTERDQLGAQVGFQDNSYLDAELTGLVDYEYANAVGWYSRGVTEQSRLGIQVTHGELDVPRTQERSNDESVRLTFDHAFERHLTLALSAGVNQTKANGVTEDGTVFGLELARIGDYYDWRLSASQEVTPSGNGRLVRRHETTTTLSRRLSARLTLQGALRYVLNEELELTGLEDEREYERADLRLDWRLAERWTVGAGLGYARQRFAATDEIADAGTGTLYFTWAPRRAATSR